MAKKPIAPTHYPPALMDREQAAYYLAISPRELDYLVAERKIPRVVHRLNGHPKFKREDLERYIEELRYVS